MIDNDRPAIKAMRRLVNSDDDGLNNDDAFGTNQAQ